MKKTLLLSVFAIQCLSSCNQERDQNQTETTSKEEGTEVLKKTNLSIESISFDWVVYGAVESSWYQTYTFAQGILTQNIWSNDQMVSIKLSDKLAQKATFLIDEFPSKFLIEKEIGNCGDEAADGSCFEISITKNNGGNLRIQTESLPKDLEAYGKKAENLYQLLQQQEKVAQEIKHISLGWTAYNDMHLSNHYYVEYTFLKGRTIQSNWSSDKHESIKLTDNLIQQAAFLIDELPSKFLAEKEIGNCNTVDVGTCFEILITKNNEETIRIQTASLPQELEDYGTKAGELYMLLEEQEK